jgi:hypothetical protein
LFSLGVFPVLVKTAILALSLTATLALANDTAWKQQSGRFATFETPAAMSRDTSAQGVDSIIEPYKSPDISLTFDSEIRVLPADMQQQFERTVAAWAAQRRQDWRKSTYVDGGGAIHGYDHDPDATTSTMPYYLYYGFAAEDANFSIHIRFRSLDSLDEVERILKSIKFNHK